MSVISAPDNLQLVLASRSPRRAELLAEAGFQFIVDPPEESVEAGCCSKRPPATLVAELSFAKAFHVARKWDHLAEPSKVTVVLGADTVAECGGSILGKPENESHAARMLELLSGRRHRVLTGITLIVLGGNGNRLSGGPVWQPVTKVVQSVLKMDALDEQKIADYLASNQWIGKAGAFGFQDGLDWVHLEQGLASTVVGLPVELLAGWIGELSLKQCES